MNPFGVAGWPGVLQPFVDLIPLEMVALLVLGAAAVITRYRRGDRIERLQIRWLASAVAVIAVGFAATVVSFALGNDNPPITLSTTLIAYAGILLMPIAIGIAILRYRLFEIDRIISRTIGWAVVTGVLGAVFAGTVVGLQAILARRHPGRDARGGRVDARRLRPVPAGAAAGPDGRRSPVRPGALRRRADGAAFAERLRDQVDLAGLEGRHRRRRRRGAPADERRRLDPPVRARRDAMTRRAVAVARLAAHRGDDGGVGLGDRRGRVHGRHVGDGCRPRSS